MWRTNPLPIFIQHLSFTIWILHLTTCFLQSVLAQDPEPRSVNIPFVFQGGDLLALESKRDEVQEIMNRTKKFRATTPQPDIPTFSVVSSTKRLALAAAVRAPTTAMPEFFPIDDEREAASDTRNTRVSYNTLPSPSITKDISLDTSFGSDTYDPPPKRTKSASSSAASSKTSTKNGDETFDNWQTAASGYGGEQGYAHTYGGQADNYGGGSSSYGGSSGWGGGSSYGGGGYGGGGGYSGGDSYSKGKDYSNSDFYAEKPSYQSEGYSGWGGGGGGGYGDDNTLAIILAWKLRKERQRYDDEIAARDYYIASRGNNGGGRSSGGGGLLGAVGGGLGALGSLGGGMGGGGGALGGLGGLGGLFG